LKQSQYFFWQFDLLHLHPLPSGRLIFISSTNSNLLELSSKLEQFKHSHYFPQTV